MKIPKASIATARRLFRACSVDGRLNEAQLADVIRGISADKPRGYRGVLLALKRLVQLELGRRRVVVESSQELDPIARERIAANLRSQHGDQLSFEFRVDPAHLGGLRVRVGDDVWDGTVKGRLDRLAQAF